MPRTKSTTSRKRTTSGVKTRSHHISETASEKGKVSGCKSSTRSTKTRAKNCK